MISPRFFRGVRLATICVLGLLAACDIERAPEREAPTPSPTPSASPKVEARSGSPVSKPDHLVTVHYHRHDENYDQVNLWTWDSADKNTPKQNSLEAAGRDAFGVVFQFDPANYGGAEKIGLIPRLGPDWSHKDGGDKFWTPALGHEVWLVSKKDTVFTKAPDVSPQVEAAYIDAPNQIIVRLTKPAPPATRVTIVDQKNTVHPTAASSSAKAALNADNSASAPPSLELAVTTQAPLDFAHQRYSIRVEGFGDPVPLTPRGLLDNRELFFDASARLGAIYTPQATTFRIFTPTAKSVRVVHYDETSGDRGRVVTALNQQPKGLWDVTLNGDLAGKFYAYLLDGPDLDSTREVLDPYATNAVANSTRGRITEISGAVRPGPRIASPTDMVIYEMHVRDFTVAPNSGVKKRGLYLGWTEANTRLADDAQTKTALDHLTELGVTHVQLLPVQDFQNDETSGQYNWGYITNAFFSPEGMFASNAADGSRVRELKALIDALHARGIGVIMDVVYNHTGDTAPFLFIAPQYYYRHMPNGALANGSGCGNEIRSEAPMVRRLIIDSLKFWVKNYGVDGFRFDLMALIDQETMREAERELRAINPSIVLYGEPWMAGTSPLSETIDKKAMRVMQPIGAFNDDFRNALKGMPDGDQPGWIQNGSQRDALKAAMLGSDWFASPAQSLNYMTCHDNLVLWDKLKLSMPGASDQLLEATMKLGYLALFTSQGVPFIHGGEEFARSKGGHHNSYDAPDSVNQVDWSLKRKHIGLFSYTRDLIALRKAHPVFRLRTREEVANRLIFHDTPSDKTLMFILDGTRVPGETWKRVCVILNSDDSGAAQFALPPGQWSLAFDDRGPVPGRSISGNVSVPQKSGIILYQR